MDKRDKKRTYLDVLDPSFKKQIETILSEVNTSVSRLYEAATQDRKTKVYNYSFYRNIFEMEFEKAKRGLQALSLLIIDIDFFKVLNDKYGHVKADKMLEKLAQALKDSVRKSDIVARFGGEEFVVLFPATELRKACKVSLRLRNKVKKDSFLKKFELTISGGITEYFKGDNIRRMQQRADKALYEAKKRGRDMIISAEKGKLKKVS